MVQDKEKLDGMTEQLNSLLPELRKRREMLELELKKEREAVKLIAECDLEELKEYKMAIAEQSYVLPSTLFAFSALFPLPAFLPTFLILPPYSLSRASVRPPRTTRPPL